jgi:hypothetical protein
MVMSGGVLHSGEGILFGLFCDADWSFSGATGMPHLQLLFGFIGRGVFGCLIVINPEAENFSVFPVDADTVLSDVTAVNPHTIALLIRKISI